MVTLLAYATRASLRPAATLIEIFTGSVHSRDNAAESLASIRSVLTDRQEADAVWVPVVAVTPLAATEPPGPVPPDLAPVAPDLAPVAPDLSAAARDRPPVAPRRRSA